MAVRANVRLELALRYPFLAGAPIAELDTVLFGADDDTVLPAGANDEMAFGLALKAALPGQRVNVVLFGLALVELVVGTGGATRGKYVWRVADGITDAPPNGGGTKGAFLLGRAMQSGDPKDRISVLLNPHRSVTA